MQELVNSFITATILNDQEALQLLKSEISSSEAERLAYVGKLCNHLLIMIHNLEGRKPSHAPKNIWRRIMFAYNLAAIKQLN